MNPSTFLSLMSRRCSQVWAFYVCTSLADVRYTIGTKLGEEFASNSELSVMEGAGAADYPPFLSGTPAVQGVEYTFYTPRQFNGILFNTQQQQQQQQQQQLLIDIEYIYKLGGLD